MVRQIIRMAAGATLALSVALLSSCIFVPVDHHGHHGDHGDWDHRDHREWEHRDHRDWDHRDGGPVRYHNE